MDNKQFFSKCWILYLAIEIFFYVKILFAQVLFTKWGLFSEYEWKHYLFLSHTIFGAMCEVTIILHAKMYVVVIILVWPSPDLMICWATLDGKFFWTEVQTTWNNIVVFKMLIKNLRDSA